MIHIIDTLSQTFAQKPERRFPTDYLGLRNGKLDLDANFINTADFTSNLPALVLGQPGPVVSLASSAAAIQFDLQ